MTAVRVRPAAARGHIRAPPSKSYTHRALVVGFLSRRPFRVLRPLDSQDTRATASALTSLGARIQFRPDEWRIFPARSIRDRETVHVQCHESGTTLRFVSALAGLSDRRVVISGAGRLSERPIDELLRALTSLGAECRHVRRHGLPIEVRGPIHGGRISLDASESSQFGSALLLALPTLAADSSLDLTGTVVSRPYLDATIAVLAHHGVRVDREGRRFRIRGGQRIRGSSFRVPGDASSAAYLWTAAAITDGKVRVDGLDAGWPQADLAVLELLSRAGAKVGRRRGGATVSRGTPRSFGVDLSDAPDLYPLAGVLAATIPGVSRIVGAPHIVLKESDRKAATARLVRQFGARVQVRPSGLVIRGTDRPRAIRSRGGSDHRLVMSAAVGALAADAPSSIGEREAVRKSYPEFWRDLASLTGGIGPR